MAILARFHQRSPDSVDTLTEAEACVLPARGHRAPGLVTLISSCGLRLSEGVSLLTSDIDRARMVVHMRGRKGGCDRYVPLLTRTLDLLGAYWRAVAPVRRRTAERGRGAFPNREATGPIHPPESAEDVRGRRVTA